ncbi:DUF4397 domain-containing protein [Archangium violaceum]|uniref:DUF4397 domain-containing protein n=1 Tax=Archangium violaceum TaxID=83451 RepID=UPI002B3158CA|nr:DUF4397 domain-containing protein [Archangium gephyra]
MFDRFRWGCLTVLGAALIALAGCGDDEELPQLRFIHASPDMPAVDVYVNELAQPLFTNVSYGMTTESTRFPTSPLTLHLRPAGSGLESPPLLSSQPLETEKDAQVSFVAAGEQGSSTSEASSRILPIQEDFAPPAPGMIRVRIVHTGTDAPTLNIDMNDDNSIEVKELERFTDSGAAGLELPAQIPVHFRVRSEDPRTEALGFTLQPLPEGSTVLVVATGLLATASRTETGFSLIVADTQGLEARVMPDPVVYVLNASEEAGPLDVFLVNEEQADALGFGALSSPILISPGVTTLDVFAAAPTSLRPAIPALFSHSTAELKSGELYLLVATGTPSSSENDRSDFTLTSYAEEFTQDSDQARLSFIHASASAPVMDAAPLDGSPLLPRDVPFNDVAYTQASVPEGVPIPSLELTLGVQPATETTGAEPTRFEITPAPLPGEGLFGVLAGTFRSGDTSQLSLVLVSTATSPWSVEVLPPSSPGGGGN